MISAIIILTFLSLFILFVTVNGRLKCVRKKETEKAMEKIEQKQDLGEIRSLYASSTKNSHVDIREIHKCVLSKLIDIND